MSLAVRIDHGTLEVLHDALPNDLNWLQMQVDGYIEIAQRTGDIIVLCNEEGRLTNMEFNIWRWDGEPLVGPLIVVAQERDDFRGLTQEELKRIMIVNNELYIR